MRESQINFRTQSVIMTLGGGEAITNDVLKVRNIIINIYYIYINIIYIYIYIYTYTCTYAYIMYIYIYTSSEKKVIEGEISG